MKCISIFYVCWIFWTAHKDYIFASTSFVVEALLGLGNGLILKFLPTTPMLNENDRSKIRSFTRPYMVIKSLLYKIPWIILKLKILGVQGMPLQLWWSLMGHSPRSPAPRPDGRVWVFTHRKQRTTQIDALLLLLIKRMSLPIFMPIF